MKRNENAFAFVFPGLELCDEQRKRNFFVIMSCASSSVGLSILSIW